MQDGVRRVSFSEAFEDETRLAAKIPQSRFSLKGRYQIIDQGDNQVAGYSDAESGVYENVPVIAFGDHTRAVKYVDAPFLIGADGVKILKPKSNLLPRYAYYALRATRIPSLGYSRHFKVLKESTFRLPPLAEQKRIAAKLDAICEIVSKREEQLKKLDQLVKSRFVEMFGDPLENMKYPVVPIGDLCEVKSGGTPDRKKPEYWQGGGIPWVKTTELQNCIISDTQEKITDAGMQGSSAKLVPPETILIAMYGQGKTRGMTGFLNISATTNQACACLLPGTRVIQKYLWQYLILSYDRLRNLAQGAGQPNLNGKMIKEFAAPLPPKSLQEQFVAFVEQVDKSKFAVRKSLESYQRLYRQQLQEAFG